MVKISRLTTATTFYHILTDFSSYFKYQLPNVNLFSSYLEVNGDIFIYNTPMNAIFLSTLIIFAVFIGGLLGGCQPSDTPSDHPFVIDGGYVVLHKSHLLAVKTELFAPSFALQGVILPKQEHNVVAPANGKLTHLVVEQNQSVDKEQTLAWFAKQRITQQLQLAPPPSAVPSQDSELAPTKLAATEPTNDDSTREWVIVSQESYDTPYAIKSPIVGKISRLYAIAGESVKQDSVLMTITDDSLYQFVSVLPAAFDKHIEVGDHVNFSLTDDEQTQPASFSGQVAKTALNEDKTQLSVTVHIIPSENDLLSKGLQVSGWIGYGDLTVGAVVPAAAFADGVNLHALTLPPYKPATPTPAGVWVVRQNGTLTLASVHIVAYKPNQDRYLVTGISGDSLIVSANLPISASGLPVKVR